MLYHKIPIHLVSLHVSEVLSLPLVFQVLNTGTSLNSYVVNALLWLDGRQNKLCIHTL